MFILLGLYHDNFNHMIMICFSELHEILKITAGYILGHVCMYFTDLSHCCNFVGQSENNIDRLAVVETKKSSTGVTVNWFQPITVDPVLHYEVNVYENLLLVQNFTTNETKAKIENLKPDTEYSINVKAVVDGDEDVPETTINVATEKSCMYLCMPVQCHVHKYILYTLNIINSLSCVCPIQSIRCS